ncbi:hypothetical protein K461DRAFT_311296 [Myriangium duriaei CBS 260.36]|uniref:Uncharacterized protein n=1 Tax=Myriangium duriaei CBS 260.36 TaxID=1168546 RepID=A0A9P4J7N5_9PEZI|nr:hypothetical protein K461DRAFT_311296 [Myriangium duriaei CBS 260.36]
MANHCAPIWRTLHPLLYLVVATLAGLTLPYAVERHRLGNPKWTTASFGTVPVIIILDAVAAAVIVRQHFTGNHGLLPRSYHRCLVFLNLLAFMVGFTGFFLGLFWASGPTTTRLTQSWWWYLVFGTISLGTNLIMSILNWVAMCMASRKSKSKLTSE